MRKKIERGPFEIFQHPLCLKTPKKLKGTLWGRNFSQKSCNAEKTESGDPSVSSGIVCYAGNFFGSVPCAKGYNLAAT